jgi:hypothetical protein
MSVRRSDPVRREHLQDDPDGLFDNTAILRRETEEATMK